ncbi:MAG: restriction endonuclease subunit S [Anaerobiospirillum succiniciproducens]|uniref:restriction endonuclease subunit S n=1 Tax=Anaerobiospirillum succiniciproducens TaxID=13335 RepID=UPI0026DAB021|nr:restriction endonuclease subunit S [Anaerobiospirillum succiniciproducens]MDO4675977.1 restriction endonuclease subunit S [Anaerobiospirillum succiniciproducens]
MAKPNLHFASLSTTAKSTLKQLKLSEAATFLRGSSLSKDDVREVADVSNGVPCVLYGHLYTTYGEIAYSSKYVTDAEIDEKVTSKAGDVLMPTSDVTPRGLATATCVMFDNAIVGGDINILRPQPGIDGRYLSLAINSQKQKLYPLIVGSTIRHLHASDLKGLSYFFPSIEEQQKIAEFFTALDEKIELSIKKYNLFSSLKKAYASVVFDSLIDCQKLAIGEIANTFAGATPSTSKKEFWENGAIPWMSSGEINKRYIHSVEKNITQSGYDNSSTKWVRRGTTLIAIAGQGSTRGKVAFTEIDLCTNQSLVAIECDNNIVLDKFLFFFLETQYGFLRSLSDSGGGRGGLNLGLINGIKVPIPSLNRQREVIELFESIDHRIDLTNKMVSLLALQKKAFMQRMFV